MKDRKRARFAPALIDATIATVGLLILTLALPTAWADTVFRTEFGPLGLTAAAAMPIFLRYNFRSRRQVVLAED